MTGYEGMTPTVEAIGKLNFTGNIVPRTWRHWLKRDNGKINSVAIDILAELIYWYRPIEVVDEMTGKVIGWRRKFKADKLQKSYAQLSEALGHTKRQISENAKWLKDHGYINLEFRHFPSSSNVLFIDLNVGKISDITFSIPSDTETLDPPSDIQTSDDVAPECEASNAETLDGVTPECKTYTENTNKDYTDAPPTPQGDVSDQGNLFNQDGGSQSKATKNTTGQKDQLGDADVIRILEAYNENKPQLWAPHSTEKIKSRRTPATKLYNLFEDMNECLEAIKFALLWAETHPQYSRREPWNKGTSDETWFNAGLTALTYKGRLADWSELGEQQQLDRIPDNPDAGLTTAQQIGRQLKRLKRSGWLPLEWEQKTGCSFASDLPPDKQEEYLAELQREPDPPPQEPIPASGKPVSIPVLGQSLTERRSA